LAIKSTIGLKDLVTAELLTDTVAETTYDTVEDVAGSIMVEISDDSGDADIQYADDSEYDRLYPLPKLSFSMEVADIPPSMLAKFFGHATDANGVIVSSQDDLPPYRAFGFKSKKADGQYRYVWLLKCIPTKRTGDHEHETEQGDSVNRKTSKIEWEAVPTIYTGEYQYMVDDDDTTFVSSGEGATFFDAPYSADVSTDIEISVQPLDQYLVGGAGGSLTITAAVGVGTPDTYQWYKATGKTYAGAAVSAYTGNATDTLTIPTNIADETTHYFYCKLSNAGSRDVYSEIAVVVVGDTP
jgi:phi13 family phage major tail protein